MEIKNTWHSICSKLNIYSELTTDRRASRQQAETTLKRQQAARKVYWWARIQDFRERERETSVEAAAVADLRWPPPPAAAPLWEEPAPSPDSSPGLRSTSTGCHTTPAPPAVTFRGWRSSLLDPQPLNFKHRFVLQLQLLTCVGAAAGDEADDQWQPIELHDLVAKTHTTLRA